MRHHPEKLDKAAQAGLLGDIRRIVRKAPLYTPTMPRTGRPMSVMMTNAGPFGWVTDKARGYRYQREHPKTGAPWPPIPASLLALWAELSGYPHPPEACLINYYTGSAKMGLHQDQDEEDFAAPVLSVSLGDTAIFRVGGPV
ncbi:MAG: alpha-ketoglutarate-dependent dioxygenase AlkB, partial [Pseudomonadota bacterium]